MNSIVDYNKIEINFTSAFTSQVAVSGKIILEGSKDLNPDFRYDMVNDIKINADKL